MTIQLWTDLTQIKNGKNTTFNLALMKISAYHNSKGDLVEWYNPDTPCDILYCAKIFSEEWTKDCTETSHAKQVIKGGTGYKNKLELSTEIEHTYPDYSLYPHLSDTAVGFLTRGCPNGCEFCCIEEKEGLVSKRVATLSEFWNGQPNITLFDPNILACSERMKLLAEIAETKAIVKFEQGLDARFITDEVLSALKKITIPEWYFAWDLERFGEKVKHGLLLWKNAYPEIKKRAAKVYVLVNFNTSREYDIERCKWLEENGFHPYVMIYEKWKADDFYKMLASYYTNYRIAFSPNRPSWENFVRSGGRKFTDKIYKLKRKALQILED